MNKGFEILDWDSQFFGFEVCKITTPIQSIEELNSILKFLPIDTKLTYLASDRIIEKVDQVKEGFEVKYVDEKITFQKEIRAESIEQIPQIKSFREAFPSPKLIDLAIQSGVDSRYNRDEKIGKEKFEELYRLWMINSVAKKIAEEVLIYKVENEIAGMVTLGVKNQRTDIGIIAVDSVFRGKGIGKKLMRAAEYWSLQKGRKGMQVVTQGVNQAASRLYEKSGYTIGKIKHFYHIWRI